MNAENPTQQPIHIFAIAAISKDGFIGNDQGHVSTDWTSQEDKQWFWQRTAQAGAVVMGRTTFFATRRPGWPLPDRMNYVLTRDPKKVWDLYPDQKTRQAVKQKKNLQYLTAKPQEVIERAAADQFAELAVCGGTSVYTDFLPFVKTIELTREPVELGGGLPLFAGHDLVGLDTMLQAEFELTQERPLNNQGTLLQTWQRQQNGTPIE